MTLLLTECSSAGIVMAADSAISWLGPSGQVKTIDHVGWRKVIRAPKAKSLVGYWGFIGKLYGGRFDEWLEEQIKTLTYHDVPSLAQALADLMNVRCGGHPLAAGEEVGFHVAGYHPWSDGTQRPFFLHVHNGHGHFDLNETRVQTPQGEGITKVDPKWISDPRSLFAIYQDFPSPHHPIQNNIATLPRGYITRNGSFLYHAIVWERLRRTFEYLNLIPHFSIPSDPSKLGPRKGLMIAAVQNCIDIFKSSNQSKVVGGKVSADAVGPNGYFRSAV